MKRIVFASMLMLGMVGCATPPETSHSLIERQELKVDPEVIYIMEVTELFQERLSQPGGGSLLQVQFAVDARSDAELAWKVTWFDDSGMKEKVSGKATAGQLCWPGSHGFLRPRLPTPVLPVTNYIFVNLNKRKVIC